MLDAGRGALGAPNRAARRRPGARTAAAAPARSAASCGRRPPFIAPVAASSSGYHQHVLPQSSSNQNHFWTRSSQRAPGGSGGGVVVRRCPGAGATVSSSRATPGSGHSSRSARARATPHSSYCARHAASESTRWRARRAPTAARSRPARRGSDRSRRGSRAPRAGGGPGRVARVARRVGTSADLLGRRVAIDAELGVQVERGLVQVRQARAGAERRHARANNERSRGRTSHTLVTRPRSDGPLDRLYPASLDLDSLGPQSRRGGAGQGRDASGAAIVGGSPRARCRRHEHELVGERAARPPGERLRARAARVLAPEELRAVEPAPGGAAALGQLRAQPRQPAACSRAARLLLRLVFRWLRRAAPRRVCANEARAPLIWFSPLDGPTSSQREQSVQCVCCMKAGRERCAPPPPHDRRPRGSPPFSFPFAALARRGRARTPRPGARVSAAVGRDRYARPPPPPLARPRERFEGGRERDSLRPRAGARAVRRVRRAPGARGARERRYQTIFCSATCFEQAWPRHREFHVGAQASGGDGDKWGRRMRATAARWAAERRLDAQRASRSRRRRGPRLATSPASRPARTRSAACCASR